MTGSPVQGRVEEFDERVKRPRWHAMQDWKREIPAASSGGEPGIDLSYSARQMTRTVLALLAVVAVAGFGGGYYYAHNVEQYAPDAGTAGVPTIRLNTGYLMPKLGLGTSQITGLDTTRVIAQALVLGYRHFDTAIMYANEVEIGRALEPAILAGLSREDLFIATKLDFNNLERKQVEPALRGSLKRLGLDYVDLFYIHWPVRPDLIKETWAGMEDCVDKGLVRSIGLTNFSPEKIEEWFSDARMFPAVNQVEVHPHWRNQRSIEYGRHKGMHTVAYAPLSSPTTMATMKRHVPNLLKNETVVNVANKHGKSPAQVLLAWGLQHGATVIPRATVLSQQKENIESVSFKLPAEDYNTLATLDFQLKYFNGQGIAIGKGKAYATFADLWNEEPNSFQRQFDGNI